MWNTFLSALRDWPLLPHARINLGFQEVLATAWKTKPIYENAALSGQIWVMPTLNQTYTLGDENAKPRLVWWKYRNKIILNKNIEIYTYTFCWISGVCMCVQVSMGVCLWAQVSMKFRGIGSPEAGVPGSSEPCNVVVRSQTWVLYGRTMFFLTTEQISPSPWLWNKSVSLRFLECQFWYVL